MWFHVEENLYLIKYIHISCEVGFFLTDTLLTNSQQMSVVNGTDSKLFLLWGKLEHLKDTH